MATLQTQRTKGAVSHSNYPATELSPQWREGDTFFAEKPKGNSELELRVDQILLLM